MADADRPDDIDPDSGCRLPLVDRERLDPAAREVFDRHLDPAGGSIAGLRGPGGIRLHSPGLSPRMSAVTTYFRSECGIPARLQEVMILVAAREMESQFEWTAHEPKAVAQGVPEEVIAAIKHDRPTGGLPETDALIIAFGRELFRRRRVAPETYARALEHFGATGLVDMVSLMGNYAATALLLAAFDMQLPPGTRPLLPTAGGATE